MKNKKLFWLPLVLLLVLTVLTAGFLTACGQPPQPEVEPTESQSQTEPTQPAPTQPEPTETEPVDTEPDVTEPEETESSGNSGGGNMNTGTGGGYDPGATEPEGDATEPAIEVPAPGSENNPYYENVQNGAGEFTTVKIPAGATVYYRIRTAGTLMQCDGEVSVALGETVYEPQEGKVELTLPGAEDTVVSLSFTNRSAEDQIFLVAVMGDAGSRSNPLDADLAEGTEVTLEEGDVDGLFYRWTADKAGMLKLWAEGDVEINVLVEGEPVQLSRDNGGKLCAQVKAEDEILVQLLAKADAEGNLPAVQTVIYGYVAKMVKQTVSFVPFEAEAVTVEAGKSVYFTISGVADRYVSIAAENACLYYGEETIYPNNSGILGVNCTENTVQIELCNTGDSEQSYVLKVNNPLGTVLNPEELALGEEITAVSTEMSGYYYSYTASDAGILTLRIWTAPETEEGKPVIRLTNQASGETAELTSVEETVSVAMLPNDQVQIYVAVTNIVGDSLEAQMGIFAEFCGTEENPIVVEYPGFTAKVPAGQTLYYGCYNMNGVIFSLNTSNAVVAHNGQEYSGEEIMFFVVCQGRDPGVIAITNPGEEEGTYNATFSYPVGWMENPAPLVLGNNTLTQQAGAKEYYYAFTAAKAGKLTLTFDEAAQWVYCVNNLTQGIYGDTQWSDSDPLVSVAEIAVQKGDQIQITVNTYDKDNAYENPEGTVVFQASFETGPVEIADTGIYTTASLVAGEACRFTGKFQGLTMRITGAKNAYVVFDGETYQTGSDGAVKVEFPEGGEDNLSFVLHNGAANQVNFTILFSTKSVGSADNPEMLSVGSYSMVQSAVGGTDHYYKFVATSSATLTFTFETDVNAIFVVNGNIVRYTHMGQNTYSIRVRPGAVINLVVNTYDPANPMVSPLGTVDFTVSLK